MTAASVATTLAQSDSISQTEVARINFLIGTIGNLKDAQFIRNGSGFTASEAVAHLRYKWRAARSSIFSAQDFIREVATKSSVSGMPYTIRFADGHEVTAAEFLQQQLRAYDKEH